MSGPLPILVLRIEEAVLGVVEPDQFAAMVDQTGASWNPLIGWLRKVDMSSTSTMTMFGWRGGVDSAAVF